MHLSSIVKPPARQITVVFSWDKICHNYRTEAFFLQNISVHILMCRCSHLESFFFFLTRFLRCRCFFQVRPTSWPWYVLCNWPLPWSAWSSVWAEEKTRWRQIHVQMNECIYNIYDTCVMDMLLKRYAGSISAVYEVPMIYKAYVRCILYTSIYCIYIYSTLHLQNWVGM